MSEWTRYISVGWLPFHSLRVRDWTTRLGNENFFLRRYGPFQICSVGFSTKKSCASRISFLSHRSFNVSRNFEKQPRFDLTNIIPCYDLHGSHGCFVRVKTRNENRPTTLSKCQLSASNKADPIRGDAICAVTISRMSLDLTRGRGARFSR